MSDELTNVKGAKIRCIHGVHYVVVKLSVMFPGAPPTILGLAQTFRLPSERVFDLLLNLRPNTFALRGLHRDHVGGELPAGAAGLQQARRELLGLARQYTISPHGRTHVLSKNPFETWGVRPIDDAPIVLPLSEGFLEVLDQADEAEEREAEAITREIRIAATKPLFSRLNELLGQLKGLTLELELHVKTLDALLKTAGEDLNILEMLQNMIGWMGTHPKDGPPSASDRDEVVALKQQLDHLLEVARLDMTFEPISEIENAILRDREDVAKRVFAMLEPESELVVLLKMYRESLNLAPDRLHSEIPQLLESAYTNLLLTRRAETVVKEHVFPLIDLLASRSIPATHLRGSLQSKFSVALQEIPAPSGVQNALTVIGGLAAGAPLAVGNLPGPASLCVAVVGLANAIIGKLVLEDPDRAVQVAAKLTRMLVSIGYLTAPRATVMIRNISAGSLKELVEIDWTKNFQRGPIVSGFLTIMFMVSLYLAITNDDPSTLRRWANIIGSASGATLGIAVALNHLAILSNTKVLGALAKGNVGRALGVIGGVASIVAGTVTAVREFDERDTSGVLVGGSAAFAGAATVVGFLMSAGFIAEGTAVGIPVGLILQFVGLVVGLGATAIAVVRDTTTAGTQLVFKSYLLHFARPESAFTLMKPQSSRVVKAFDKILASHHSVDFWAISPDAAGFLVEAMYPIDHIPLMVEEDPATVLHIIQQQKDPTL